MIPETALTFAGSTHAQVRQHLFPGDGCEAAAILLCARTPGPRRRLLVRQALLVPHHECSRREPAYITWPGSWIEKAIDAAEADGLTLVLIHSHPGGYFAFSDVDDESDRCVMPGLFQALGVVHGSAIMTPEGAVRARLYTREMQPHPVEVVTIVGDDLLFYWGDHRGWSAPERRPLAFTGDMAAELARLSAAVVGVSGTGSIIAEQLTRLGFGCVYLIDYDRVESKNLNRILNSCLADVETGCHKVRMFADAVIRHRGDGVAVPVAASIASREAVMAASQADILFSCVDTLDARQVADLIASAFLIPLIDVGVVIPVRKAGVGLAIADVAGRIDYVQPDGASLGDRGVYTPGGLRAEHLRRVAPEAYQRELEAGYVKGAVVEAPAVITLNMRAASAAVNEFIARAYPFRLEPNRHYARTQFSLAACEEEFSSEDAFMARPSGVFAQGDQEPLLGLPILKTAM